jgi:hypothetical protein
MHLLPKSYYFLSCQFLFHNRDVLSAVGNEILTNFSDLGNRVLLFPEAERVVSITQCVSRSAAGGRNEETYSGYAEGIPVEQYPSRRQHKQKIAAMEYKIWYTIYP